MHCTDFVKIFPLAIHILKYPCRRECWISRIIPKMHDYLQILKNSLCAINNSNTNSELTKRFFRKFRSFLAPGLQVRKSRISRDKKRLWKIVVILTIFGKSTIFQSPLKSVDEAWHRRYKISDLRNYFNITYQKIMKKFHDIRLMLKNCWGGERSGVFPPPSVETAKNKELEVAWFSYSPHKWRYCYKSIILENLP